jgi:protein phosphatase
LSRYLQVTASGGTDIGQNRDHNEDTVLLRADMNLFIVADGAGGHNAGNVASALATTSLANAFESTAKAFPGSEEEDDLGPPAARRLAAAIHRANKDVVEIAKSSNKYHGMGTTVVAASFSPETQGLHVAHVGDSRCYRLRAGNLEQLTYDHSLLNDVLEMRPDIDDAALARLPRHVVTRALGMDDDVRVSVRSHRVLPGDRYLLCSDGLTDALDEDTLAEKLGQNALTPDSVVRALIDAALFCGADDNIAVLVLMCGETNQEAPVIQRKFARTKAKPRTQIDAPPPSMRGQMGSAPEIIVVGVEEHDGDAPIHVVPAESATAGLLDAFAGLRMRGRRPSNPGD